MMVAVVDSKAIYFSVMTVGLHFFNNSEFCTSSGFIFLDFGVIRDDNFLVYQLEGSAFC